MHVGRPFLQRHARRFLTYALLVVYQYYCTCEPVGCRLSGRLLIGLHLKKIQQRSRLCSPVKQVYVVRMTELVRLTNYYRLESSTLYTNLNSVPLTNYWSLSQAKWNPSWVVRIQRVAGLPRAVQLQCPFCSYVYFKIWPEHIVWGDVVFVPTYSILRPTKL